VWFGYKYVDASQRGVRVDCPFKSPHLKSIRSTFVFFVADLLLPFDDLAVERLSNGDCVMAVFIDAPC
jgi:hypothetical protein